MKHHQRLVAPIIAMLILVVIGCDDNENARLANMAEQNLARQEEQNRRTAELQREVAAGSRRLVEADAEARKEVLAAQQQLQAQQAQVGQQRDALDQERREIAVQRHRDPIIATTIRVTGLLLACLLPLILCLHLLRQPIEPADDRIVAEVLLADLVAEEPLLLAPREQAKQIHDARNKPSSSNYEDWPAEE